MAGSRSGRFCSGRAGAKPARYSGGRAADEKTAKAAGRCAARHDHRQVAFLRGGEAESHAGRGASIVQGFEKSRREFPSTHAAAREGDETI